MYNVSLSLDPLETIRQKVDDNRRFLYCTEETASAAKNVLLFLVYTDKILEINETDDAYLAHHGDVQHVT